MVTQALKYDPSARYEVRVRDVEYLKTGGDTWLARVYEPQGPGPFPALIDVHGGAWFFGDRMQNEFIDNRLAASGIVVVALDFHNSPQAPYPGSVQDVNYGVRWLKHHAAEFKTLPESVGIMGTSSGGPIAMLVAMRPRDHRYMIHPCDGNEDASPAYVVLGWPVIDPTARYNMMKERGNQDMLDKHHLYWQDMETMSEGNPQHILERGETVEMPPTIIAIGAADEGLTPDIAERFTFAYSRAGGQIELCKYPGSPHAFLRDPSPNTDRAIEAIKSFIGRQLANG
jgi:acetyl esterase/lipase